MADAPSFTKLVPGFDFLQGLVKNAGSALPSIGQWVAPTLDPQELEKRIEELRTVQFWLEQNARMLGATIQALEVQRMTLSTLRTMNVQMDDLTESLKIRVPPPAPAPQPRSPEPARAPAPPAAQTRPDGGEGEGEGDDAGGAKPGKRKGARTAERSGDAATGPVDPMQWWGALTKQFSELAASALKESVGGDAARNLAGSRIKQESEAGGKAKGRGAQAPARAPRKAAARKRAGTKPAE